MARTVIAIFDNKQMANEAVRELIDRGFSRENISIVANQHSGMDIREDEDAAAEETGAGAGVGAGIGAAIGGIGGLLVGVGALTVPGIGPVIAAGPLAVTLSTLTGVGVGAVAGGISGGLLGALMGMGVPEEEAGIYAESVRRGSVLVTVMADDTNSDQIITIMNQHEPVDLNTRVKSWREQGWAGYDPNAQTVENSPPSEISQDESHALDKADVEPEESALEDNAATTMANFEGFDPELPAYHTYFNEYLVDSGESYAYYVPAFRYGFGLQNDPRFQGSDWETIEPQVRQEWEQKNPNTWERFKNAVRIAWENVIS